jgi:hypothetical protein
LTDKVRIPVEESYVDEREEYGNDKAQNFVKSYFSKLLKVGVKEK